MNGVHLPLRIPRNNYSVGVSGGLRIILTQILPQGHLQMKVNPSRQALSLISVASFE
jgi:hypothetical protein